MAREMESVWQNQPEVAAAEVSYHVLCETESLRGEEQRTQETISQSSLPQWWPTEATHCPADREMMLSAKSQDTSIAFHHDSWTWS